MLKLVNNKVNDISVTGMRDGDLAVITEWVGNKKHGCVGAIVQRYKDILIAVGQTSGKSWTLILSLDSTDNDCRVRLLEKGETLIVAE